MQVKFEITYDLGDAPTEEEEQTALDDAVEAGRVKFAETHDLVSPPVGIIIHG